MAAVRLVYIGGGSTRAPGTIAALVERGAAFARIDATMPSGHLFDPGA